MTISFVLDWGSFFLGAISLLLIEFAVLIGVSVRQYLKSKKR